MDIITNEHRFWRLIVLFTTTMICSVAHGFSLQHYDELPIENITYDIHSNQIEIETETDLLIESESWISAELQFDENNVIPVTDNHKIIISYQYFDLLENAQDASIKVNYSYNLLGFLTRIFMNPFSAIFSAPKHKTFKIKNAVKALKDKMLKEELGVALKHYAAEIENLDDYTKPHKRRKLFLFHFAVGEAMVLSDIVVSQGIANHVLNIIAMKAATTGKIDTTLSEAFALLKIIANPHHLVTEISETMMNICPESTVLTLTSCEQLNDFLADDITKKLADDITKKLESFFKKAADVLHKNVILESNTKDPNHPSFGLAGATVSIEETPVMRVIHFFAGKYNGTSITLPKGLVSYSTEQVYTGFEAFHFTKTESECGDWCIYTKKIGIEDADIYDAFYRLKDPYIVINRHVTCTEHRRLMENLNINDMDIKENCDEPPVEDTSFNEDSARDENNDQIPNQHCVNLEQVEININAITDQDSPVFMPAVDIRKSKPDHLNEVNKEEVKIDEEDPQCHNKNAESQNRSTCPILNDAMRRYCSCLYPLNSNTTLTATATVGTTSAAIASSQVVHDPEQIPSAVARCCRATCECYVQTAECLEPLANCVTETCRCVTEACVNIGECLGPIVECVAGAFTIIGESLGPIGGCIVGCCRCIAEMCNGCTFAR